MTRSTRERKAITIAFLLVLIVFLASFLQAREHTPASNPPEAAFPPKCISIFE